MTAKNKGLRIVSWVARATVLFTFGGNLLCVIHFLVSPDLYASAYELSGVPGRVAIQGIAIAFLMWNATYPLVIIDPIKFRTLFVIVLVQQLIGLIGETLIYTQIGAGYEQLSANIMRFISFDALGLVLMGVTYSLLIICMRRSRSTETDESSASR